MAQNITLQGASYSAVPSIILPKTGGGQASFVDVTDTTAAAADVASGKYFYTSSGVRTQGTSSGGSGGGITKVVSSSFYANTTSTSQSTLETWTTGHTEIWTSSYIVYVKVRDHAGARDNYFYGSDNFFCIPNPKNGSSATSFSAGARQTIRYTSSDGYAVSGQSGSTGYGVYADCIYSGGLIRLRKRYNSTYSLTINGTYDVEVYLISVGTLFA